MGRVHALNLSTGASAPGWPLKSVYDPTLQHNYGGLTLSPDGTTLYVAVAGMCDQNVYVPSIAWMIPRAFMSPCMIPGGHGGSPCTGSGGGGWGGGGGGGFVVQLQVTFIKKCLSMCLPLLTMQYDFDVRAHVASPGTEAKCTALW